MPVDHQHKEYRDNLPRWRTNRAVLGGSRQVKREDVSREIIFPLSGHKNDEPAYRDYVLNAHVFPGAARAVKGFVGLLNEDPAEIKAPAGMEPFLKNVTRNGAPVTAEEFVARVVDDVCRVGRDGVLTDYPERPAGTPVPSKRDVERLGIYPKWRLYLAEDIWDWHEIEVGGATVLAYLSLHETREVPAPTAEDEHAWEDVEQWRLLDRAIPPADMAEAAMPEKPIPDGRVYRSRIYRKDDANPTKFLLVSTSWPRMNGRLMAEIPWDWMGSDKGTSCVDQPPLEDAVEVNATHIRVAAAHMHAVYFVANPKAYLFGYDPDFETPEDEDHPRIMKPEKPAWRFGSSEMLVLRNAAAQAGIIAASAADLSGTMEMMRELRDEMVAVVGRILAQEKKAAEAAKTEELRREGEKGVLTALARVISAGMTRALERARDFMGLKGEVSVRISTEFFEEGWTPDEALAIADLWIKYGLIAKSDVRRVLRRGSMIDRERTDELIDAELAEDPIPSLAPAPGDGEPAPEDVPPEPAPKKEPKAA